jgi:2-keto-4-pentenoate hydratase
MENGSVESAARLLVECRLSRSPIDLAEPQRPKDEADGYVVQREVNHHLLGTDLGSVVGHKIGCTTPVMQALLGIHSPCSGEIFAATVFRNRAQIESRDYLRPGAECEIAIELLRDIMPEEAPFTRMTIGDAVGAVMAAIEIVDDRYHDYASLGVPTLIADNFFNAGCVLGDPITDWRALDLANLAGMAFVDGRLVGKGTGAMVLGHPLDALAWLANAHARQGRRLQAGRFVLLGSLVATQWLQPGEHFKITIESLGTLDLVLSQ